MSTHVRPAWTLGASRKRKERLDPVDSRPPVQAAQSVAAQPASGGRLLAGYLAHEFLTKGTLLGKPVGPPSRAEAGKERDLNRTPEPTEARTEPVKPLAGAHYADVSRLLMRADGPHVPGVVNPTQLARWLEM